MFVIEAVAGYLCDFVCAQRPLRAARAVDAVDGGRVRLVEQTRGHGFAAASWALSLRRKRMRLRSTFCGESSGVKARLSCCPPYSLLTPPCRVLKPCSSQGISASLSAVRMLMVGVLRGGGLERSRSRLARCFLRTEAAGPGDFFGMVTIVIVADVGHRSGDGAFLAYGDQIAFGPYSYCGTLVELFAAMHCGFLLHGIKFYTYV